MIGAAAAMMARDPLFLPACPACSSLRADYGRGHFRKPGFHFGQNSYGYTLNSECLRGCPVWADGPGEWRWLLGRPLELSEAAPKIDAARARECQAELAAWWRGRVLAFDFSIWSAERLEAWKASLGGAWLAETSNAQRPTSNAQ